MSTQNMIAGLLTAFGVIGLAIAPTQTPSMAHPAQPGIANVTVAISLGTQLRLDQEGVPTAFKTTTETTQNMVCSNVYRLPGADVGLGCRHAASSKTIALIN